MTILTFLVVLTVSTSFWYYLNKKTGLSNIIRNKFRNRILYNFLSSFTIVLIFFQFMTVNNRFIVIPMMMSTVNAFLIKRVDT